MTTNDIDAIRKLTDAADPGPWVTETNGKGGAWINLPAFRHAWGMHGFPTEAEFIAAARTHVPALCDEIEQLRAQLAEKPPAWATFTPDDMHAAGLETVAAEMERDAALRELEKVRDQLTAANHRADGLAADVRTLQADKTAYANENAALKQRLSDAYTDGRNTAAADIENMPINLGDAGWKHLEQKATEAGYPAEAVRRRRTRGDFTTATIEVAYQYGYRQAARVARGEVTR